MHLMVLVPRQILTLVIGMYVSGHKSHSRCSTSLLIHCKITTSDVLLKVRAEVGMKGTR